MQSSKYITPTLGRKAIAILLTWFLINVAVYAQATPTDRNLETLWPFWVMIWLVGVTYGYASGTCWIAALANKPFTRYAVRLVIASATMFVMTRLTNSNWLRQISNLGGLLVCQSILFFLLSIPDWQFPAGTTAAVPAPVKRRQFRIADIIIATTSIAILLSIAIRYTTPIDSMNYWVVMLLVWLVCPLIAASLFMGSMSRGATAMFGFTVLAIILAAGTVLGLSVAEDLVSKRTLGLAATLPSYSFFMLGYFVTLVMVGIGGRSELDS